MRILCLLLLATQICYGQSSFFVGAQGSFNRTTLLNKEDKNAPAGMLKKKSGLQPGYGLQLGYRFNNFSISIEPNYLNYKISYSGQSDTAYVRSFYASSQFKYYQFPLVISYGYPINKKLSLHIGLGASYNYLSYYKEEFDGKVEIINSGGMIISEYYKTEGKKGYDEAKGIPDGKVEINYSEPWFKNSGFSAQAILHPEYKFNNHLSLAVNIILQKSLTDIENKGEMNASTKYIESGQTYNNNFKLWEENKYARYYFRSNSQYNQRPSTYTMAIGMGIGIKYYFKGQD